VTGRRTVRGRFITLEGGEGAGKSTQMRHLAEWLRGQGIDVVTTREPGGSPKAETLRELLLGGRVAPFGAEAEALVFAIARADHVAELIRPALEAGRWVISDRFFDSTRAYQGASGVSEARLTELETIAVGDDRPDLTLILDLPVEEGMRRVGGRVGETDRFERDDHAMHEARRAAYLAIAGREPERCAVIDACAGEAAVAEAIRAVVAERLKPALAGAR
jgi:dTMP kinase